MRNMQTYKAVKASRKASGTVSNHAESQRRRQESPSTDSPSHLHIEELSLEEQQDNEKYANV
jgi:hypothetical protein